MRLDKLILIGALALPACGDPVGDAKARLALAQESGTLAAICREANGLKDAYMEVGDSSEYRLAARRAAIQCTGRAGGFETKSPEQEAIDYFTTLEASIDRTAKAKIEPPKQLPTAPERPAAQCWQGYCPCDEDGASDKMLCRNLGGGLKVSPEMFAAGAAQKDARNEIEKWNTSHPGDAIPTN